MAIKYIGLDFETSGTDPWGDAAPIQIGMTVWASSSERPFDSSFKSLIGGWDFKNEYQWSEESESIHKFTRAEIDRAPRIHEVDVRAATWMYDNGLTSRIWNITVGWNVAGFDRQFVTRHFSNLNRLLSYRTVDLNALVFAQAGSSEEQYKNIKNLAKREAAAKIGGDTQWHDALYDAKAALHSLEFLTAPHDGGGP